MLRTGLFVSFVLFLIVPLLALAQDTAPDSSIYCPNLTQTLSFGFRDSQTVPRGQVTELQKFLSDYYDLDPEQYVTGYFGRKTRDNVRKFQCEKLSLCSGSEANGWGVVGPKTRAKIRESCGSSSYSQASYYNQGNYYAQGSYSSLNFTATPSNGTAPLTVSFRVSAGDEASFSVEFGDDTSAQMVVIDGGVARGTSHTYGAAGTYTAKLHDDRSGCSSNDCNVVGTATIVVTAPGQICEHANPPTGCYWQFGATCAQDQLICPNTNNASCTLDGVTVAHGATRKFYSERSATSDSICQTYSIDRSCQNGTLSGASSYQYASCTAQTTTTQNTFTPTPSAGTAPLTVNFALTVTSALLATSVDFGSGAGPHQITQSERSCAGGGTGPCTGNITYTYTSPGTYTARLLANGGYETATAVVTVTAPNNNQPSVTITAPPSGTSVARGSSIYTSWTTQNMTGNNRAQLLFLQPGQTVESVGAGCGSGALPAGQTSYTVNIPTTMPLGQIRSVVYYCTAVPYPDPGSIVSAEVLINVTGPTASAQNQTQLANALSALERALRSLLQLLGQ